MQKNSCKWISNKSKLCPGSDRRKGRRSIYTSSSQYSQLTILIDLNICVNSFHFLYEIIIDAKLFNKKNGKQEKNTFFKNLIYMRLIISVLCINKKSRY